SRSCSLQRVEVVTVTPIRSTPTVCDKKCFRRQGVRGREWPPEGRSGGARENALGGDGRTPWRATGPAADRRRGASDAAPARGLYGDWLLEEVACSLESATAERVEDELRDLSLLTYCRDALERYRRRAPLKGEG